MYNLSNTYVTYIQGKMTWVALGEVGYTEI